MSSRLAALRFLSAAEELAAPKRLDTPEAPKMLETPKKKTTSVRGARKSEQSSKKTSAKKNAEMPESPQKESPLREAWLSFQRENWRLAVAMLPRTTSQPLRTSDISKQLASLWATSAVRANYMSSWSQKQRKRLRGRTHRRHRPEQRKCIEKQRMLDRVSA